VTHGSNRSADQAGALSKALTPLQGQYLAFIRTYTLIHRQPPAEADMRHFFRVTPPTVHQMILTLEKRGALSRVPGRARSLRVLLSPDELPALAEPPSEEGA
jgi:DNA-binding MarR family transcriptional regulator